MQPCGTEWKNLRFADPECDKGARDAFTVIILQLPQSHSPAE